MDISNVANDNFKIKSKLAVITTSPLSIGDYRIYGAGEYEISGVSVLGFKTKEKETVFSIESERINMVFLGNLQGKLDEKIIDEMGDVDVILVCNKQALTEGQRLDPYFIVSIDEESIKEAGFTPEVTSKFSIKKEDIIEDQNTKVIVLTNK